MLRLPAKSAAGARNRKQKVRMRRKTPPLHAKGMIRMFAPVSWLGEFYYNAIDLPILRQWPDRRKHSLTVARQRRTLTCFPARTLRARERGLAKNTL